MILNSGAAGGGGLSVIASGVLLSSTVSDVENIALPKAAKFVLIQTHAVSSMTSPQYKGFFMLIPGGIMDNTDITISWEVSLDSDATTLKFTKKMMSGDASFEYVAIG